MGFVKQGGFHPGSILFSGLSESTGMALDQINFIVSQVVFLVLASILRTYLHPAKAKASTRHWFELLVGLLAGLFCFGRHAMHLLIMPGVCYIVIAQMNPKIMQRVTLIISLIYLSVLHLYRQIYDYGSSNVDITGPIMVMTQKVTSLAFSLHDGTTKSEEEMNRNQKFEAIRETPCLLSYFSYCLSFQTLMAGPSISYKTYIDFIEGKSIPVSNSISKKMDTETSNEPSPFYPVLYKVLTAAVCGVMFIFLGGYFPISGLKDSRFLVDAAIPFKFWYMYLCLAACRLKYYFAWMFADAICNNSGLGFNGYTENGKEKWDGVSNVDIFAFETGTNLKETIDAWNIRTNVWLRTVAYERAKKYPTLMTFGLSALWHGFYPGYYITFASGAIFTSAARIGRRHVRHFFLKTNELKAFYDVITLIITRLVITYITFPFVLLELGPSLQIYMRLYWCLHISAVALWVLGPFIIPKPNRPNQRNPGNVNVNQIENTLRQVGPITNSSS
ncbi:lysophospholipid acyltransferase 2 isoform X3 [Coccinella septempunctata]|uniref:lysophospholipid acyltransferase 2 isoform X3 n=1 Tax=Coccinella septempunctata TaxID=41139 RepID=UPI001D06A914|nr:lysophospholipid acyltransferase 2 isoform X3 [Coccinella septempunctata]